MHWLFPWKFKIRSVLIKDVIIALEKDQAVGIVDPALDGFIMII